MKDFKDVRVVGAVMVHDDSDYTKLVLDNMAKFTKEIYVNLNDPTPEAEKVVLEHPAVVSHIYTTNGGGRWNQGVQREKTVRMLDDIKPDIILFPDSDELYPPNLTEQLEKFWADEEAKTFWFRLLYLWGDENHFRNDGLFKSIHHVRAFKWQPGIVYVPKYCGYALPRTYLDSKRFHSNLPTMHYGYEKEINRVRKYGRANCNYCDSEYRDKVDAGMIIEELPEELKHYV